MRAGTTADEETVTGTLEDIEGKARAAALAPPVVIVVGATVALRTVLAACNAGAPLHASV